jgi:DNA adenine methylase
MQMHNKWVALAAKVLDAFGSVEAVTDARDEIEKVIVSGLSAVHQAALEGDFIPDGRSGAGKAAIKVLADRAGVSPGEYVKSPEHKAKLTARKKAQTLVSNYWKTLIDRISPDEEREVRPMTGNPSEDLIAFAANHGIKEDSEDFLALMNSINNLRLNPPVAPVQRALFPAPAAPAPLAMDVPPPTEPDPTPRDVSFLVNTLHNPNHRYPSILAIGRSGSGKSMLIRNTIEANCSMYALSDPVLRVIVVSGTVIANPAQWQGMRIGRASFCLRPYDADEVKDIWVNSQATKEHTIIVFDDVMGLADKDKSLMQMYTQGRQCKMQVMLLAQSIRGVASPTIRRNAYCNLFTKLHEDDLKYMFSTVNVECYKKVFIAWNRAYSRDYAFTATIGESMFLVKASSSSPEAHPSNVLENDDVDSASSDDNEDDIDEDAPAEPENAELEPQDSKDNQIVKKIILDDERTTEIDIESFPKSIIPYMGAKTKVGYVLASHVPNSISTLVSIFIGGGSFEFLWLRKNPTGRLLAHDTNKSLITMYEQIQSNPDQVQRDFDSFHNTKAQFAVCKLAIGDEMTPSYRALIQDDSVTFTSSQIAASKIFVHSMSFNSGGQSMSQYKSDRSAHKIIRSFDYSRASFILQDCLTTLSMIDLSSKTTFVYLDPPYFGKEFYYEQSARNGFNHEGLRDKLREMTEKGFTSWMLSYADVPQIRDLYSSFCNFYPLHMLYASSMGKNETTELIIKPKGVY